MIQVSWVGKYFSEVVYMVRFYSALEILYLIVMAMLPP